MSIARTWVALLVVLALPATLAATASSATGAEQAPSTVTRAPSLEELVLQQVNAVRAAHRLAPLAASSALSRSAADHSRAMASLGFFAHESSNGMTFSQRIRRYYGPRSTTWSVGENLAMFGGVTPSASSVVDMWMASPSHRANVLRGSFREAGVADHVQPRRRRGVRRRADVGRHARPRPTLTRPRPLRCRRSGRRGSAP